MFSYKKRKCEMRQNVTRVTRMLSVYEVLFSYSFELVQPALICAGDVFNGSAFFYFFAYPAVTDQLVKRACRQE